MRLSLAAIPILAFAALVSGGVQADDPSPTAAETVDAFHAALAAGKKDEALNRLAPSVVVFEGGHAENSRREYASHHLSADMRFAQAVDRTLTNRTVRKPSDDVRVVLSATRTSGTFREKEIALTGRETMVLVQRDGAWKITHIHWSSSSAD